MSSPSDKHTEIKALREQRRALMKMQAQLAAMLGDVDGRLSQQSGATEQSKVAESKAADREIGSSRRTGRPIRTVILDTLEELGWPTYSRQLSQLSAAWLGRPIPAERYGSLASDEMKAFQRSIQGGKVRPVWLCFALTYDRHQPIKRLWARSDWPLETRIVAPTSGRVQHLKLTAKLCELAVSEMGAEDPEMLRIIAADHARDLPGVKVQRGSFDLESWRSMALESLNQLEPRDAELRHESAERLRGRGPYIQMFGVPEAEEIGSMTRQRQERA